MIAKDNVSRNTATKTQICQKVSYQSVDVDRCVILTSKEAVYKEVERRILKACDQMDLILSKIQDVEMRHQRAVKNSYYGANDMNYELQLHVLQGMYNMYYTYCSQKAQLLEELEEY